MSLSGHRIHCACAFVGACVYLFIFLFYYYAFYCYIFTHILFCIIIFASNSFGPVVFDKYWPHHTFTWDGTISIQSQKFFFFSIYHLKNFIWKSNLADPFIKFTIHFLLLYIFSSFSFQKGSNICRPKMKKKERKNSVNQQIDSICRWHLLFGLLSVKHWPLCNFKFIIDCFPTTFRFVLFCCFLFYQFH